MVEVDRSVQSDLTEKQQLRAELAALRLSASAPQLDHDDGTDSYEAPGLPLRSSGGNGGGMEVRIARLESDVDHLKTDVSQVKLDVREIRTDVGALRVDVATLKENVRHLPTKVWIGTVMAGMVAAIGGLVAIIVRFIPHVG